MRYFITAFFALTFLAVHSGAQRIINGRKLILQTGMITKIVSGDTFTATVAGKEETVKLIGIKAPDPEDQKPSVQCQAKLAIAAAKGLLENKVVTLESELTQGDRDKSGRLLRFIWLSGADFNFYMIQKGLVAEYTADRPYKYQNIYQGAQDAAKKEKVGIWNPDGCK